jgi:hypothetical protein
MFWRYAKPAILGLAVIVGMSAIWSAGTNRNPWALALGCLGLVAGYYLRGRR